MIRAFVWAPFASALVCATISGAQTEGLYVPMNFQRAVHDGSRTLTGEPGANYWQNGADYRIEVEFYPETGVLQGRETISYFNNSPDTLRQLVLNVPANYYRRGTARDVPIDPADAGDGVTIETVTLNGRSLTLDPNARQLLQILNGMKILVPATVLPGERTELGVEWHYTVNTGSQFRTGRVDSTTYFVAYSFPRIAVYDDTDGWDMTAYSGGIEFYNDFGDFDVAVTVPRGYVVWGTGLLRNPREVLNAPYVDRYLAAFTADTIVRIVDEAESARRDVTAGNAHNTWRFGADHVSDFAFAVSDHYVWDASSLVVDSVTGRRVLVDAAYNPASQDFHHVAEVARASIEFMSFEMPAVPFPYPQETVFNGTDEMEYPMMVNDHPIENDVRESIELTSHEIFHTYFPFYMGINETRYAWMDEGWATYGHYLITNELHPQEWTGIYGMEVYNNLSGTYADPPILAATQYSKNPSYFINSYPKPAFVYLMLEEYLGRDRFLEALHTYMDRWAGKHPTPWDFFLSFNEGAGENFNWLFQPWFFEYGYADLALSTVQRAGDSYSIEVERVGSHPVPVQLRIEYEDGTVREHRESVAVWSDGASTHRVAVPAGTGIVHVELGHPTIPDADPSNNVFDERR